jgi:hypothetical protein
MKTSFGILLVLAILAFSNCKKDSSESDFGLNCDKLHNETVGYLEYSESSVNVIKTEIDKLTKDLKPKPTVSDNLGQLNNLYTLFGRLETCGDMSFVILCYGCIDTGIPQTEVLVMADSSGIRVYRVYDFMTGYQMNLTFANVHSYIPN